MYVGVYREVTSFSEVLASQECSGYVKIAPKLQSPRKALPRHLAQSPRGSRAGCRTGPRQHVVEASGCNRQKQLFEETSNRGVPFSPSLPKK